MKTHPSQENCPAETLAAQILGRPVRRLTEQKIGGSTLSSWTYFEPPDQARIVICQNASDVFQIRWDNESFVKFWQSTRPALDDPATIDLVEFVFPRGLSILPWESARDTIDRKFLESPHFDGQTLRFFVNDFGAGAVYQFNVDREYRVYVKRVGDGIKL